MFFDKIEKIEKNYVERVENINIKVYTTNCVDNMQIDHLREWFLNPFFSLIFDTWCLMDRLRIWRHLLLKSLQTLRSGGAFFLFA